jgi:hypothetical protein
MKRHWELELNNVASEKLLQTWRLMAHCIRVHITEHDASFDKQSNRHVIPAATGTGKTEALVVYCSMLSGHDKLNHPGTLIVTQRVADCERIADRINRFSKDHPAVAYHTGTTEIPPPHYKLTELHHFPVLVITHEAYKLAMRSPTNESKLVHYETYVRVAPDSDWAAWVNNPQHTSAP